MRADIAREVVLTCQRILPENCGVCPYRRGCGLTDGCELLGLYDLAHDAAEDEEWDDTKEADNG